VWAAHLCGDQHLAVVVKHGIGAWRDGPYAFTSPALVNTVYGRWWHPLEENPGANPVPGSPLPWTGDYVDGLGNKITMLAYANPPDIQNERERADGYGIARFNKQTRQITFECWPRFPTADGRREQFPGWPLTILADDNDGRTPVGWLAELRFKGAGARNPVVQVIEDATGEILYTVRVPGDRFRPRVYRRGTHTVKVGRDTPVGSEHRALLPRPKEDSAMIEIAVE
jgi:hypothetical protein